MATKKHSASPLRRALEVVGFDFPKGVGLTIPSEFRRRISHVQRQTKWDDEQPIIVGFHIWALAKSVNLRAVQNHEQWEAKVFDLWYTTARELANALYRYLDQHFAGQGRAVAGRIDTILTRSFYNPAEREALIRALPSQPAD